MSHPGDASFASDNCYSGKLSRSPRCWSQTALQEAKAFCPRDPEPDDWTSPAIPYDSGGERRTLIRGLDFVLFLFYKHLLLRKALCIRWDNVEARVVAVSKDLTPEKAFIFRIVHRDNVPWILDHGLHCKNSKMLDPNYVEIGNPDLISRRDNHSVVPSPSGTLSDYIPFYFTPFSPMMYNIKTGWGGIRRRDNDEIVIMVSSLRMLHNRNIPFLFTDRHAYLVAGQFYSGLCAIK